MHELQTNYLDGKNLVENIADFYYTKKQVLKNYFLIGSSIFWSNADYGRQEIKRLEG